MKSIRASWDGPLKLRRDAALTAAIGLLAAGCHRDDVKTYYVPKDTDATPAMAQAGAPATEQPTLQWKAPPGWQEKPAEGGKLDFGVGEEGVHQSDFSIQTFPSDSMPVVDMVNISRQAMGLPALDEAGFSKIAEQVEVGADKGTLLDYGNDSKRVMVTILPRNGFTWYFKLAGEPAQLGSQKPAMLEFLKSVSFAAGGRLVSQGMHFGANASRVSTEPSMPPATSPMSVPITAPMTASDASPASAGKPTWNLPSGWRETAPGDMLLAKFELGGADGKAEVTVSSFPGEVGGLLANVNRWRGQVQLAPVAQDELAKSVTALDVMGGSATLVDAAGPSSRLLGVIWPRGGQTWFFKLSGDPKVAAQEKEAFIKFVQSVRFPNG